MSEIFNWLTKSSLKLRESQTRFKPTSLEHAISLSSKVEQEKVKKVMALRSTDIPVFSSSEVSQFDLKAGDVLVNGLSDSGSIVGEQYRILRAKLSLMQKEHTLKRILITSALPDEGKTFTCCSLATILAQEPERKVLVIDADLRKPKAAQTLGCLDADDMSGLCHVLRGEISATGALIKSSQMDLYLLPSGGIPQNPSELLSAPNFELALKSYAELFDWIIIDSPPVMSLADATLLASLCDAVLFVVRSEHTPGKLLQETVHQVGREKVCGIVMNRLKHFDQSHYYQYYYSSLKGKE